MMMFSTPSGASTTSTAIAGSMRCGVPGTKPVASQRVTYM
jgi:hypothetical protein